MAPPARPHARGDRVRPPEAELVLAGRAWVGGRLQPVEIGLDGEGRICAVARTVPGQRRHDVGEKVLLPAATDVHVHLREPGPSDAAESIVTGTEGAALGGVGLVGEMPNTEPPTTSPERLEEKAERVHGRAAVDVLLYAAPDGPETVRRLALHAGGFKLYLSPTTGIDRPWAASELGPLLSELARVDLPVAVHAEDPACFRAGAEPADTGAWDEARPTEAEAAAVVRLLDAPRSLRLHFAHVTTAGLVRTIRDRSLSSEATAHHLLLSTTTVRSALGKVNPPLRSEVERVALWEEYRSGGVAVLASDHAPHPRAAKDLPFPLAPSGVPGLQSTMPLMLARVARGDLGLSVLLQTACDRPARLLGQPMGRLSVGHRANVLVVDFRARTRLRGERLRSPCGWTPFEGAEVVFPTEHWRDGERIVEDGEYVGRPHGRVVRPEFAPGAVRTTTAS